MIGRGIPDSWVRASGEGTSGQGNGQVVSLANFPTVGGRHAGLTIRASGSTVTLTLSGDQPAGPVLFQLPAFAGNIASASAGTVDNKAGTVTLAPAVRSVTVQLSHPE